MHLSDRPCKIGTGINTRSEKHGDETVPACDIPFHGFMLEKAEVNKLVGPMYWESIFDNGNGKMADRVLFPNIASHKITDKYEGSVTIVLGPNQNDVKLEDVKLAGFDLTPHAGGLVELSGKIQAHEAIEKFVHKLVARIDTEINLTIEIGDKVERAKSKQQELPINTFGDGEQPEDDGSDSRAQAEALFKSKPSRKAKGRGNGARAH